MGENSCGEAWNGIDYPLGAAYFMEQTPGTELFKLFAELGIHQLCRKKETEDPVLYRGKLHATFSDGETEPGDKRQFRLLKKYCAFLEKIVGGNLHPHIETLLEHYCWSTFGCSMDEVSAAVAVLTYASEFGDVYVAPAGNAAVTERILERVLESVDARHLRTGTLLVAVRTVKGGRCVPEIQSGVSRAAGEGNLAGPECRTCECA